MIDYVGLFLLSIIVNYCFGILIERQKGRKKKNVKRFLFILALFFNIGTLAYYKYAILFSDILFPLGISFYTFSGISYLADIYKREARPEKNIINFALYVSFFPKLTMGPIEQYRKFKAQLKPANRKITKTSFYNGIIEFGYGLFKKVFIADALAIAANTIFEADLSLVSQGAAWLGAICYALQLYFDFSGYSNMARGLGRMFGFNISENFNYPYLSSSITEFWRRWHETLNKWFIKYIYIPLGGNRHGQLRTYFNIGIIFLITGIWHGSNWTFVAWGLYHGFFVIIERIGLKKILDKFKIINHVCTLLVVLFGWVLFRSSNIGGAIAFIRKMIVPSAINQATQLELFEIFSNKTIFIILLAILFSGATQALIAKSKAAAFYKKYLEPVVVIILILISILGIVSGTFNSFIYAQF